jgi:hypothetical protein
VTDEHAVRLELIKDSTYVGDKRQIFPYDIHWTCPRCGADHTSEVDYVSYPVMGRTAPPVEVDLECNNDGEDDEQEFRVCWQGHVPIRMEVYAEVVGELTGNK